MTMKRIFKYKLNIAAKQTISIPIHHEVLSAKNQNGDLVLYAIVDEEKELAELPISVYLTGEEFEYEMFSGMKHFVDTVFFNDGDLVAHVFVG